MLLTDLAPLPEHLRPMAIQHHLSQAIGCDSHRHHVVKRSGNDIEAFDINRENSSTTMRPVHACSSIFIRSGAHECPFVFSNSE
jgi:hypothetical protein